MNTQEQRERAAFTACYCDESYDQDIIILSGEDCEYANKAEQAQLWDAHCRFLAYIDDDGQLHHAKGCISWPESDAERKSDERPRFRDLTIYRLRVRPHRDESYDFMLLNIVEKAVPDDALAAICEKYRQLNRWQEAPFAVFIQFEDLEAFYGPGEWLGQPISISLACAQGQTHPAAAAIATLHRLHTAQQDWHDRLTAYAARELIEIARDWQEDGEGEIDDEARLSEADFARRIRLEEISIDEDGGFTAWFDDDNIFWGHVIMVSINADGEYEDAEFAG